MIGETLGSYRIVSQLGAGGMGLVLVGEHTLLGKRAAIKVLLPELSSNAEIVQRFFNEAKATTRIRHPNILDIYDFGTHTNGSAYIVMELLDGESLAARIRREQRLDESFALEVTRQLVSALAAAHQAGIVHRDLKPDNVFLVPDASIPCGVRVKVLDFGIAKLSGEGGPGLHKTRTGALMGTPAYMAPEQCRGAGAVDARADVYALGCILYEMVAGRPPFLGEGPGDVLAAQIYEQPPPLGGVARVSARYEAAVMHALVKQPDQRTPTVAAMLTELDGTTATPAVPAASAPQPVVVTTPQPARGAVTTISGASGERTGLNAPGTRRGLVLGVTIGVAGLLAGGALIVRSRPAASPSAPVAPSTAPVSPPLVPAPASAAKAETPAAPPVPAAPARVTLTITSTPNGAEVRGPGGVRLGRTPFTERRDRGPGEASYQLHLAGYLDREVALSLAADGSQAVVLKKVERLDKRPRPSPSAPVPKIEKPTAPAAPKGGVLDPFSQ